MRQSRWKVGEVLALRSYSSSTMVTDPPLFIERRSRSPAKVRRAFGCKTDLSDFE
jgi:hypothetical protein